MPGFLSTLVAPLTKANGGGSVFMGLRTQGAGGVRRALPRCWWLSLWCRSVAIMSLCGVCPCSASSWPPQLRSTGLQILRRELAQTSTRPKAQHRPCQTVSASYSNTPLS